MTELMRYVIVAVMGCETEEFNQLRGCGEL